MVDDEILPGQITWFEFEKEFEQRKEWVDNTGVKIKCLKDCGNCSKKICRKEKQNEQVQ